MANTLKIKRGTAATIPQGQLAEPLFTTDTYDLYIGKGSGGNQRIQNYIASGTSSDFLKGDGSLDPTTYQATSEKGQNNGYASLDSGGKVPVAQLPNSIMEYKGTWDASTNTPTLADGTGNAGDVYICSVGGTVNFGAGPITFAAGDWVVYSGSVWQKSINSNAVASVNGQTGAVVLYTDDISEDGSPTNLWFTNARARTALSATSPVQYNNSTGVISILDASASQSGVVTTGTQTFAGNKSFTGIVAAQYLQTSNGRTLLTSSSGALHLPMINGISESANTGMLLQVDRASNQSSLTDYTNSVFWLNSNFAITSGNFINITNNASTILSVNYLGDLTANKIIKSGGTSSQFLKADGSVDSNTYLTTSSASSTYLPLSGGTLTGALNGTSATFSGASTSSVQVGNADGTTKYYQLSYNNSQANSRSWRLSNDVTVYGDFAIQQSTTQTGSTYSNLLYLSNTGAATFSGNVNITVADTPQLLLTHSNTSKTFLMAVDGSNAFFRANSTNNILFQYAGGTNALTISGSTGAATFSSSVTAEGSITIKSGNNAIFYRSDNAIYTTMYDAGSGASNGFILNNTNGEGFHFKNGATTIMRMNSSNNVGIGTNSPSRTLHILGASGIGTVLKLEGAAGTTTYLQLAYNGATNAQSGYIGYDTSANMAFFTNDTERMRITSGGYLKASNDGTYLGSTSSYHELRTNSSNNVSTYIINSASTNPYGANIYFTGAAPNDATRYFLQGDDNTATRFTLRSNGGLANYSANDVNLSDIRTKKDIISLESYWDKFKAIEIVKFKYNDQTHDDYNIGVIAQQVESVAPEFVDVDGWGETPEDGVPLKSIYTADLHHATIKVLQEAMSKIEVLESELAILKNK